MNLHQKLIEIRKSCSYLKKDTEGYQFKFVSSSQTLGTFRGKMDELGVLLLPSMVGHEVRDHETKSGGHEYFTILSMSFTWVDADNPEDKILCRWAGHGLDKGEKGVGKAATYAEKYFILKFFNVATDKDDPDKFQEKLTSKKPKVPPKTDPIKPVKAGADEHPEKKAERVAKGKSQNFEFLKTMKGLKSQIAELDGNHKAYYGFIGLLGFEKSNQIVMREQQKEIWNTLTDYIAEKTVKPDQGTPEWAAGVKDMDIPL